MIENYLYDVKRGGQDRDTFLSKKMTIQLKGIATLMVFASHIPQVANLPTGVANLLAPMGYHGVAIFLFLSGYGCYISLEKNRNIVKFVKKRDRAILPSLIVVTVIAAIVNYIVNGISYSPLELILNSLGLSHGILQLTWYIEFQYFCYMASCVISKCIKCEHRAISFVALAIAIYILSVTVHGANLWGLNYASYSIGMWAALYRKKILKFINMCSGYKMLRIFAECLFLWMGLFGTTYFFLHNPTELVLRNILKGTISSAFVFALCSLIGLVNQKTCRLLEYIGTIAYEVYLIHGIFVFVIPTVLNNSLFRVTLMLLFSVFMAGLTKRVESRFL